MSFFRSECIRHEWRKKWMHKKTGSKVETCFTTIDDMLMSIADILRCWNWCLFLTHVLVYIEH